ncbi:MAG: PilZ domain-containing protein [Acidobacteriota bacterium]
MSNKMLNSVSTREPGNELLKEYTVEQLSEYHLKLSRLLERVESASTHFETLGLDPSASYDDVLHAYYKMLSTFYPVQTVRTSIPQATLEQMDKAFVKASQAFSTLANAHQRKKYQRALIMNAKSPLNSSLPAAQTAVQYPPLSPVHSAPALKAPKLSPPSHAPVQNLLPTPPIASATPAAALPAPPGEASKKVFTVKPRINSTPADDPLQVNPATSGKQAYSEYSSEWKDGNRRRNQRIKMALPTRVSGYDQHNKKWDEMTQTVDVSRTGVSVKVRRRVRCGNVVYLTLPLPTKLRMHGFAETSFNSYAIVRRVDPIQNGQRIIALEFIGEHPPKGYMEKPWTTFKTQQWNGTERRREKRLSRMEKVSIEYFDDNFRSLAKEETVTENVSGQGMRIFVKYAPFEFDLIRVTSLTRNFESLALVRNRFVGKEGLERLCVQFLNPVI